MNPFDKNNRIFDYIKIIVQMQEGSGGRGGVQFCCPKFHMVKQFFKIGSKLLFLGCGNGEEVKEAIDMGYDAYGVTLNIDNIEYAKKNYNIELYRCDMHFTNFNSEEFDGVLAFETFEHCYSHHFFLFECNRILKQNGILFLSSPAPENGTIFCDTNIHHTICLSVEQTKSILMQCNFKDIVVGDSIRDKNIINNNGKSGVSALAIKKSKNETLPCLRNIFYV